MEVERGRDLAGAGRTLVDAVLGLRIVSGCVGIRLATRRQAAVDFGEGVLRHLLEGLKAARVRAAEQCLVWQHRTVHPLGSERPLRCARCPAEAALGHAVAVPPLAWRPWVVLGALLVSPVPLVRGGCQPHEKHQPESSQPGGSHAFSVQAEDGATAPWPSRRRSVLGESAALTAARWGEDGTRKSDEPHSAISGK